ncbi:MAG TPA: class I SAM-dependent methyltransferase [Acidimicrobiales bacterium]|nr:class I SAM-dependent methyltransferase [Acidimicrobiales bacterium]
MGRGVGARAGADDSDILSGPVQRAHYATGDNLARRQSIFAHLDPARSRGGSPLQRLELEGHERVLDVGCGNGLWYTRVKQMAGSVWIGAVDLSMAMVRLTRTTAGEATTPAVQADAQALPIAGGTLDGVLALHTLHHVPDHDVALDEARRVLRPGGWLLVTTNDDTPTAVDELYREALSDAAGRHLERALPALPFHSGNGKQILDRHFERVVPARHVSGFAITDPDVLLPGLESVHDVVEATIGEAVDWDRANERVRTRASGVIDRSGAFVYEHAVTSFLCRRT